MDTATTDARIRSAATQAFLVLRVGFTAAPILFGIVLTNDAPRYYDIALRDFGLFLGAATLTRLAWAFRPTAVLRTQAERRSAGLGRVPGTQR
jgi:hypothetical protein